MPSISYNFIGDDFASLQSSYMSVLKRDFYEGDFAVKPERARGEFVMERGTEFPTPILAMKSSMTASVRRTWKHVRGSSANVYAIWVVRDGWLRLTQHGRTIVSRPGEIAIADSTKPFFAEALVDANSWHHHLIALVPLHVFQSFVPSRHNVERLPLDCGVGDGRIVRDIFALLFDEGSQMDREAASTLLSEALKALGRMLGGQTSTNQGMHTVRESRLQQLNAYIDMNLSDPNLSLAGAAKECGISLRYLCHLFQGSGTTFATILRRKRQEKALQWLAAPHMYHKTITEIAELAGYRSVASFSRIFHSEHGCTPREYRKRSIS